LLTHSSIHRNNRTTVALAREGKCIPEESGETQAQVSFCSGLVDPSDIVAGHQNRRRGLAESPSSDSEKHEETNASKPAPFTGARPGTMSESSDRSDPSDEQDDNFIVEDDPSHSIAALPLEFRNQQDLAFQFKIVCQLFVHLTVHRNGQLAFMERALRGRQQHFFLEVTVSPLI
jgi:hypothetical protein